MGLFSWKWCDRKGRLKVGGSAYVICPDGTFIYDGCYDGYGHFGGCDIYDLVVEWNHAHIKRLAENIRSGIPFEHECDLWHEDIFLAYVDSDFDENAVSKYVRNNYPDCDYLIHDWKREIGIYLACYDEDNASLDYPIKIASKPVAYDAVPPSLSDPLQGCD